MDGSEKWPRSVASGVTSDLEHAEGQALAAQRRREPPEIEKRKVWAASAGRCGVCGADLLEGRLTHVPLTLGELAHIVGAQATPGSPRGQHELSEEDRNKAENLMLVCAGEHDEIDRDGTLEVLKVEKLQAIKRGHEDWVRRVTGLDRNRGTAVLRMIGKLRGNPVELSKATASATILNCDDRFPDFPLSLERYGIEIDLRELPGEGEAGPAYWQSGKDKIDEVISHQLAEAVRRGQVLHLSVFGFARLPLLVYLGARLDDTVETAIYQRHRATEAWEWLSDQPVAFTVDAVTPPDGTSGEAVLILNVSGIVGDDAVPTDLRALPRLVLRPVSTTPGNDTISSREALQSFVQAVRSLLSDLEASANGLRRLHVLAALPMSAAVALGRAHDSHIHPSLAIYSRGAAGEYAIALEV